MLARPVVASIGSPRWSEWIDDHGTELTQAPIHYPVTLTEKVAPRLSSNLCSGADRDPIWPPLVRNGHAVRTQSRIPSATVPGQGLAPRRWRAMW